MKSSTIYPYLRPRTDRIRVDPWYHDEAAPAGARPKLLGPTILDWDENTAVRVIRQVAIDAPGVRSDCLLHSEDSLSLAVVWHCPTTTVRGVGSVMRIGDSEAHALRLHLEPHGELAAELIIRTQLVLSGSAGEAAAPLAPRVPGTILWCHEQTVLLGSVGSRFPLAPIDFSGTLPSWAAWCLDWNRDPELLWSESVCLYINTRHPIVRLLDLRNIPPDCRDLKRSVVSMLQLDLARQLIEGMLKNDDFVNAPEQFQKGSVGQRVLDMIRVYLRVGSGGRLVADLKKLRGEMLDSPERFGASLQQAFGFLRQEGEASSGNA